MNKFIPAVLLTTCVMLIAGCSVMGGLKSDMRGRGEVLKEYTKGKDDYMLIREGDRIAKYRLYSWQSGLTFGARSEKIYSIDTLLQTCAKGSQSLASVDCQILKRDPDFKEYIQW